MKKMEIEEGSEIYKLTPNFSLAILLYRCKLYMYSPDPPMAKKIMTYFSYKMEKIWG